jgi:large subunit ribosomal protein L17e
MVRYAATSVNPTKSAKTRGSYLRVHFKNTREAAQAINGLDLQKAISYLNNVREHKQAIPFRRFKGSIGRTAQGKEFGTDLGSSTVLREANCKLAGLKSRLNSFWDC